MVDGGVDVTFEMQQAYAYCKAAKLLEPLKPVSVTSLLRDLLDLLQIEAEQSNLVKLEINWLILFSQTYISFGSNICKLIPWVTPENDITLAVALIGGGGFYWASCAVFNFPARCIKRPLYKSMKDPIIGWRCYCRYHQNKLILHDYGQAPGYDYVNSENSADTIEPVVTTLLEPAILDTELTLLQAEADLTDTSHLEICPNCGKQTTYFGGYCLSCKYQTMEYPKQDNWEVLCFLPLGEYADELPMDCLIPMYQHKSTYNDCIDENLITQVLSNDTNSGLN